MRLSFVAARHLPSFSTLRRSLLPSGTLASRTMSSASNGQAKKARVDFPRSETVNFDPTSIGLPAGWKLTSFSELKG